jgi:ornithine cyclodeaminase/alanine dehydrogenase-like protein (mu-crystallin family)
MHLDAAALRACLAWPALVQALREMFLQGCEVPLRLTLRVGEQGQMLVMPAWQTGPSLNKLFGIKTVAIFPNNGALDLPAVHATYALFDATTGVPLAQMDGSELTAWRTAATSALAASFLTRDDAQHMVIVGAGRVARLLAPAMRSVRPSLQRVTVVNRRLAPAQTLAAALCEQGFDARAGSDLASAVAAADIVSCATLSTTALVQGAWLRPGTHVDLIGSFTPQMREADGHCLARGLVYIDSDEALSKSGDIVQAVAEGHFNVDRVQGTLQALCRGDAIGRRAASDITVFKSVGSALQDLAAAGLAWRQPSQDQ